METCLSSRNGPTVASSDYIKLHADQIRQFVPTSYTVLGTDGFGRSDMRTNLRRFFEVDRHYIVLAALKSLADAGDEPPSGALDAIKRYGIDTEALNPATR